MRAATGGQAAAGGAGAPRRGPRRDRRPWARTRGGPMGVGRSLQAVTLQPWARTRAGPGRRPCRATAGRGAGAGRARVAGRVRGCAGRAGPAAPRAPVPGRAVVAGRTTTRGRAARAGPRDEWAAGTCRVGPGGARGQAGGPGRWRGSSTACAGRPGPASPPRSQVARSALASTTTRPPKTRPPASCAHVPPRPARTSPHVLRACPPDPQEASHGLRGLGSWAAGRVGGAAGRVGGAAGRVGGAAGRVGGAAGRVGGARTGARGAWARGPTLG